ncbi:MAG: efflux RND transporter periplasmic adaptor subunit, partial [Pseudomonadota bacterium]
MRIVPFLTAALVTAVIFLFVFQRDLVSDQIEKWTGTPQTEDAQEDPVEDTLSEPIAEPSALQDDGRVSIVAFRSSTQPLDSTVVVRGETDAARQVNLLAETSGTVVSTPLRKGTFVSAGQAMCTLDPGTREASLAEAQARLAEAKARVPEAEARVIEAEARLQEALINDRAASRLSQDGFASETRVAAATAQTQAARAGVEAARSGLESSKAGIESAEASVAGANREIERLTIRASFDGILETDTAELGSLLQPGAPCA